MHNVYAAYYREASIYHVEKSIASSSTHLMSEEAETSGEVEVEIKES